VEANVAKEVREKVEKRILGVDLGINAPSVAVGLDEHGNEVLKAVRFELGLEELERVEQAVLRDAKPDTNLHVVMEKTFPSCVYVSKFFKSRGHKVSYAKPDQVKEGRKFLSRKVKTDARDAWVMARLPVLDPKQLERGYQAKPALQELKTLVSHRQSLVCQLTYLKNQIIRYANTVWPGLNEVFGSFDWNHARAFVRELDPEQVMELKEAGVAQFLREKGRITPKRAEQLAAQLVRLAKRTLGLQSLVEASWLEMHRQHTIQLIGQVELLEKRIEAKEQDIGLSYVKADPEQYLLSIPGIGANTAPTVLAYLGEVDRFATSRKAQGFVGLYPATDASGLSDRKGTLLSKEGPAPLRRDLFLVSDAFRRCDPLGAYLYYDQMVNKGKHHISALCVVANRLVIPRIVAVLKAQRTYELRDLDGHAISKEEAKEIVAQFKVSERVRRRLRSRKRPASNQCSKTGSVEKAIPGRPSPKITSELDAPRNGRAPRRDDFTSKRLSLTKDQLAMMVFRNVDRLLNSGGSLEEIRFELYKEATSFFKKMG
jgi:transposase